MQRRIVGWQKLNATCNVCANDRADITFVIRGGEFIGEGHLHYHWGCLPPELKIYQENSERSMVEAAMTPPGS